jgi:hypothetical protein
VENIKPQHLTTKSVIKTIIATLFIVLGVVGTMGSIVLILDESSGYTLKDLLTNLSFTITLLFFSYLLLKKT